MRSPRALRHPGDVAVVRELAQTDPAHAELAVDGPCATAATAAGVAPGGIFRLAQRAHDLGLLGQCDPQLRVVEAGVRPSFENGIPSASSRAKDSSSLTSLVVIVMSMPRTWSTAS